MLTAGVVEVTTRGVGIVEPIDVVEFEAVFAVETVFVVAVVDDDFVVGVVVVTVKISFVVVVAVDVAVDVVVEVVVEVVVVDVVVAVGQSHCQIFVSFSTS